MRLYILVIPAIIGIANATPDSGALHQSSISPTGLVSVRKQVVEEVHANEPEGYVRRQSGRGSSEQTATPIAFEAGPEVRRTREHHRVGPQEGRVNSSNLSWVRATRYRLEANSSVRRNLSSVEILLIPVWRLMSASQQGMKWCLSTAFQRLSSASFVELVVIRKPKSSHPLRIIFKVVFCSALIFLIWRFRLALLSSPASSASRQPSIVGEEKTKDASPSPKLSASLGPRMSSLRSSSYSPRSRPKDSGDCFSPRLRSKAETPRRHSKEKSLERERFESKDSCYTPRVGSNMSHRMSRRFRKSQSASAADAAVDTATPREGATPEESHPRDPRGGFEIGDRVEIIKEHSRFRGHIAVITEFYTGRIKVVMDDDGATKSYYSEEIAAAPVEEVLSNPWSTWPNQRIVAASNRTGTGTEPVPTPIGVAPSEGNGGGKSFGLPSPSLAESRCGVQSTGVLKTTSLGLSSYGLQSYGLDGTFSQSLRPPSPREQFRPPPIDTMSPECSYGTTLGLGSEAMRTRSSKLP